MIICWNALDRCCCSSGSHYTKLQFGQELLRNHFVELRCRYRVRSGLRSFGCKTLCVAGGSADAFEIFDRPGAYYYSFTYGDSPTSLCWDFGIGDFDCVLSGFLAPTLFGFAGTGHCAGCQIKMREWNGLEWISI